MIILYSKPLCVLSGELVSLAIPNLTAYKSHPTHSLAGHSAEPASLFFFCILSHTSCSCHSSVTGHTFPLTCPSCDRKSPCSATQSLRHQIQIGRLLLPPEVCSSASSSRGTQCRSLLWPLSYAILLCEQVCISLISSTT